MQRPLPLPSVTREMPGPPEITLRRPRRSVIRERRGRCADLIDDNAQLFSLLGEPQDGRHRLRRERPLAGELARAIINS